MLPAGSARADWINLTGAETAPNIAEITVFDDRVEVALEVYVGDLKVFEQLIPDDWLKDIPVQRPPKWQRMAEFSSRGLSIVTDGGETLQAQVRLAEPRLRKDRFSPFAGMINPYTRRKVPDVPEDKRVLYVELVYPFGSSPPTTLTIAPPLGDQGLPLATVGFIVYHKAVPVIDFRYLSGPSTLTLDPDPWYSRFDNPNLKRHHKSALMSYLYVEPYEVRHEILTRVRDLEAWMDLGLRGDRYIEPDELEPLKQRIGEFLLGRNPVLIDGRGHAPILDRANYVRVSLTGIRLLERPERLEIDTAIIGVIITYLTDGMPQQVTLEWDLFTEQVQEVPATATDPAGPLPTFLTPGDNVHTWTNYLKKYRLPTVANVPVAGSLGSIGFPWASVLCGGVALVLIPWALVRHRRGRSLVPPVAGLVVLVMVGLAVYPIPRLTFARPAAMAGELFSEQAQALLQALLKNVYRAFDFRDEEDVYDKLALSVSGDLLADVYLQNRRSFAVRRAGGAQARVHSVEIGDAVARKLEGPPLGYAIRAQWAAQGSVGHWGHVHTRRNSYDAVVTVRAVDGTWKITDLEVLEEKRVAPSTGPGQVAAATAKQEPGVQGR